MESPISEKDIGDEYSSLPREKFGRNGYQYQWNGFWFTPPLIQGTQQVLDHFKPLSNDIIFASFPKTGTTWLKALLYCIINRSSRNSVLTHNPHMLVPTLEAQLYGGKAQPWNTFASTKSSPRILATHLPYQVITSCINSSDCRVVYIARNPKDTLISLWHFFQNISVYKGQPWPLEVAVDNFCNGSVIYGPYYDHVLGFWKESLQRPEKVFFVTYEELKHDTKIHVKRMAEFLQCSFEGDEEDLVDEIIMNCSFEKLSSYEVNKSSDRPSQMSTAPLSLFRQGEVGDHKNYLTTEIINRIDKLTEEKFHGAGFMYGI